MAFKEIEEEWKEKRREGGENGSPSMNGNDCGTRSILVHDNSLLYDRQSVDMRDYNIMCILIFN